MILLAISNKAGQRFQMYVPSTSKANAVMWRKSIIVWMSGRFFNKFFRFVPFLGGITPGNHPQTACVFIQECKQECKQEGTCTNQECICTNVQSECVVVTGADVDFLGSGIAGDANGDALVNMKDVLAVRKNLANLVVKEFYPFAADMNSDGTVNLKDVLSLRKTVGEISA